MQSRGSIWSFVFPFNMEGAVIIFLHDTGTSFPKPDRFDAK